MKKAGVKFFLLAGISILLSGCLEEINDIDKIQDYTWNPELALPISNSTFGLVEFLETDSLKDYITTDQDGLIILTYQDDLNSQNASSYVEIPDETFNQSISFESPLLIQLPIQFTVSKTESFNIILDNAEGDEIDSAILKSGSLELDLQANFPASGEVSITFYSALENGQPMVRTYPWTFTGQQPVLSVLDLIDLSSIKFDLTEGGTTFNSFQFDVAVSLTYEGQPVLPTNSLDLSVKILNADFESAFGKIATRSISSDPETISLEFFDSFLEGSFRLDEPRVSLEFTNSYGIPIGVNLGNLTASKDTQTEILTGSITTSQQIINAPDINQVGDSVVTTIVIDNNNSNLPDLLSLLPTEITYQVDGTINPQGLNQKSFVLGESVLNVGLNVELPLIGRISDLKVDQEFDLDGSDVFDNFNYALFQITVENGFPLGADIQVYFLDQFGQTLDVLIEGDQSVFEAANVNAEGIVTTPTTKVTQIEINKEKLDAVRNTKHLRLEASFQTSDNGNVSVKMLDSYELGIKMGIQTQFNIVFDL